MVIYTFKCHSPISSHCRPLQQSPKDCSIHLCNVCVMSLLFNMLSRFVIAFLPGRKCLLISWLQSPSAVILEPKKIVCHCFHELRRDSRVTTGISAFPLGWPWEAQSSPRVARESWGLRSSHCRAEETSPRRVSGTYYSSPGKAGISGLRKRTTITEVSNVIGPSTLVFRLLFR